VLLQFKHIKYESVGIITSLS